MNINKTICVIMVVMVAGITVGCITPEDSGSDRYVDDEYTPTPEQYQVPDTVTHTNSRTDHCIHNKGDIIYTR